MCGSFEEGKEPVKGKIPELSRASWKDRLIDADEPVVVPPEERQVSKSSFRVADDTPNLKRAGVSGQGWFAEIVKDRATIRTKKG
jgi:hypothetical protein